MSSQFINHSHAGPHYFVHFYGPNL